MTHKNQQGISHLRRLQAIYGMRGLAARLGIYHGSIQHAYKIGKIQPGLAIKISKEFGISLKDLGH